MAQFLKNLFKNIVLDFRYVFLKLDFLISDICQSKMSWEELM